MAQHHPFETTLAAAQRGDERAAERLYHAYHIAAEVWLAAARALPDFEGDERGFRSWLFTVAKRRVIEHRRRGLRRRTDPVDPATFVEARDDQDSAVRATDLVDAQRAVDLIAEHLSPDQAEVLILRVVADLSAAQVAQLMQRPEAWVRITQHRALKRLSAHLGTELEVMP
jgi:RNA polymerase sigma-70 factor (ECF subfamily)